MSWNNGNGDGPWGGSGGNQNPWGGRNNKNPHRDPNEPDIDEMIRRMQARMGRLFPNGGRGPLATSLFIGLFLVIFIAIQGGSQGHFLGFYRVNDGETAVIQRFGAVVRQEQPGLRWLIPLVEKYTAVSTTRALTLQFSGNSSAARANASTSNRMVTRDLNLIEMDYTVQWRVKDPEKFLFRLSDPEGALRLAAESVVREFIGRSTFDEIIPPEQTEIINPVTVQADGTTKEIGLSPAEAMVAATSAPQLANLKTRMQERLQALLDEYESGIFVADLQLTRPVVPAPVKSAYDGVQQAGNEAKSAINRATVDANSILAEARGEADSVRLKASAYKTQVVESARGEADRFAKILEAYKGSEKTTTARLYLETMENILAPANKIILNNNGNGAIPYLPLEGLRSKRSSVPVPSANNNSSDSSTGSQGGTR